MRKLLTIILTLAMIISFGACGKDAASEKNEFAGLQNPMTSYTSLEDINTKYNVHLMKPGIAGVSDESFYGIDSEQYGIAQYNFVAGGYEYCFRATADTFDDISGIYNGEQTIFYTEAQGEPEEDMLVVLDNLKAARWFIGEKQYVLSVNDNGEMEEETFKGIVAEMKALSDDRVASGIESFIGSYYDSYSQRASLDITANDDGTLHLLVNWGSSASETDQWEMNAEYTPDGALYYTDGVHSRIIFPDDANEEVTIIEENQIGSFTVFDDGQIAWMGATDEDCKECVFEKASLN